MGCRGRSLRTVDIFPGQKISVYLILVMLMLLTLLKIGKSLLQNQQTKHFQPKSRFRCVLPLGFHFPSSSSQLVAL